jgi:aspartyl protease family protein
MAENRNGFHRGKPGRTMNARKFSAIALLLLGWAGAAGAFNVQVVGLSKGKALVVVDGGKPRTLREGEATPEGVRLIRADSATAVLEVEGVRRSVGLGQAASVAGPASRGDTVTLTADPRGHFTASGRINGAPLQFIVDTGATMVTISTREARRLGVDYTRGDKRVAVTANGPVPVYLMKLDEVQVGDVTLRNVDAAIQEGDGLTVNLLGMSFLNRVEMNQNAGSLTLKKRY